MKPFFRVLSALVLLAACSRPATPPHATSPRHEWQAREYAAEYQRLAKAQPDRGIDVASYALKGNFDWTKQRLFASVDIALTITADSLDQIVLDNLTDVKSVTADAGPVAFQAQGKELTLQLGGKRGEQKKFTIVYEAAANHLPSGEQSALLAIAPRAGDPINARVVSTLSEPLGAIAWLPCHDDPSDRATFAISMTMPEDETMVANGDLHQNDVTDGVRTMAYSTKFTLPNYLMAFSIGQYTRYAGLHGRKPIGIWARRGLPLDVNAVITNLDHTLSAYEKLLGDYPLDQYVIVLLPEYTGGEEHFGITFQGEVESTRGDLQYDVDLLAHEMGHQWFGDLVTVTTWDDLWIKEGMATLLSGEARRYLLDEKETGELGGSTFEITDGDRIRDTSLPPDDKYTSGPYGRSAWTLTQVRAQIGEQHFWAAMRAVLKDFAFGSITTEQFLGYFEPYLGKDGVDRWRTALEAKRLPRLKVAPGSLGQQELSVEDPDGALLTPIELRWQDDNENVSDQKLVAKTPFDWNESDSRLLLLEPRNITPLAQLPGWDDVSGSAIGKVLVPRSDRQRSEFSDLSATSQEYALTYGQGWDLDTTSFPKLLGGVSSEPAKYVAIQLGCALAKKATSDNSRAAWKAALLTALVRPPFLGLPQDPDRHGLSDCRATIGDDFLQSTWQSLLSAPGAGKFNETTLTYAFAIGTDAATYFPVAKALAQGAPSVRARRIALQQLTRHLKGVYPKPDAGALPEWTAFLREELKTVSVIEMLAPILQGLQAAQDTAALPVLAQTLPSWVDVDAQKRIVCSARELSKNDSHAWDAFRAEVGDTARFAGSIRKLLDRPDDCQ